MAINNIKMSLRNARCDIIADAYDAGTTNPNGKIRIYSAGFTTLLAELDFSTTAYGPATNGVATANAISEETSAPASGVATVARWVDKDDVTVHEGTVGTSGADINLNTTTITTGDTISIILATLTEPGA